MEINSITLDTEQVKTMERLRLRLDDISNLVLCNIKPVSQSESAALQVKTILIYNFNI